jgi:hypothetical protein
MSAKLGRGRRNVFTSTIASTTAATKITKLLRAAKVVPPRPTEPREAAEPPPVAIAAPPVPPPTPLPPPLGVVVPHANALAGAQTAKRRASAPPEATLRPALITLNTVSEFNAATIEIRPR